MIAYINLIETDRKHVMRRTRHMNPTTLPAGVRKLWIFQQQGEGDAQTLTHVVSKQMGH